MIRTGLIAGVAAASLIVPQPANVWVPPKPTLVKNLKETPQALIIGTMTVGILAAQPGYSGLSYTGTVQNTSSGTSPITYASVPLGAEDNNREIFIVAYGAAAAARTVSSATIGGISATLCSTQHSTSRGTVACFFATVPTGTTATVSITWSSNMNIGTTVAAYRVVGRINHKQTAQSQSASTATTTGTSTTMAASVTIPAGGFGIFGNYHNAAETTTVATITKDLDATNGTVRHASGSYSTAGAVNPSWSWTTSAYRGCAGWAFNR